MINLDFNDLPVRPAVEGTYELPGAGRGMYFTIGRDYVEEKLKELLRRRDTLSLDIESFGLGNLRFRIKVVTLADDKDAVILDPRDEYQYNLIKWAIKELKCIIIHNSMYDCISLYQRDLMDKKDIRKVIDTIILSRQSSPGEMARHTLENLSEKHLGLKAESKKTGDYYFVSDIHMVGYIHGSALDTLCTYRLASILLKEVKQRLDIPPIIKELSLNAEEKEYILWREQHVNHILLERMAQGLQVDIEEADRYKQEVKPVQNRLEIIMKQHGMTIQTRTGSYTNGNQLIDILSRMGAIPPAYPNTAKTRKPSTKEEDLQYIDHPLAKAFTQNKKLLKDIQYHDAIVDEAFRTNRVFPTTKVLGARTGRFSMSDPALQQFSPKSRGIIIPENDDKFSSIDWSQVEPMIVCYLANDTVALTRYEDGAADFYTIVADITGLSRKESKVTLLAQMYGQGLDKLALQLGKSRETAREYRDRIFAGLPAVKGFIEGMKEVGKTGLVHSLMGRVVDVERYQGKLKEYTAVNYMVQSSAFDLLAESLIRIDQHNLSEYIYFSIHDELIISNSVSEEIAELMRTPPERMTRLLDREPVIRCTPQYLGDRWAKI